RPKACAWPAPSTATADRTNTLRTTTRTATIMITVRVSTTRFEEYTRQPGRVRGSMIPAHLRVRRGWRAAYSPAWPGSFPGPGHHPANRWRPSAYKLNVGGCEGVPRGRAGDLTGGRVALRRPASR